MKFARDWTRLAVAAGIGEKTYKNETSRIENTPTWIESIDCWKICEQADETVQLMGFTPRWVCLVVAQGNAIHFYTISVAWNDDQQLAGVLTMSGPTTSPARCLYVIPSSGGQTGGQSEMARL
jgi:hypothetical protein